METAIGIAIGIGVGVALTFAGTYYLWVLQRTRKELGHAVLSANVLIPGPPEPTPEIKLMVLNQLIDPQTPYRDMYSEVNEVLGFRVLLKNTGNQPLVEQTVTIDLAAPAVTLSGSPEAHPDFGDKKLEIVSQAGSPHRTRVQIPFLNPGQEIIISLQSIRNDGRECRISAGGPGLNCYDLRKRTSRNNFMLFLSIGAVSLAALGGALALAFIYLDRESRPAWALMSVWGLALTSILPLFVVSIVPVRWVVRRQ